MWTWNSKLPFGRLRTSTASSKSRAVSPSMVTMGRVRIVVAMVQFAGVDDRLELLRLLQHLDRKAMRQVELADHDLDIDAEIVFVAEDLDHAAARVAASGDGQSVISTSTTTPSRSVHSWRRASLPRTRSRSAVLPCRRIGWIPVASSPCGRSGAERGTRFFHLVSRVGCAASVASCLLPLATPCRAE